MPPSRRSPALPPALTLEDVDALRERIAGGERPRVVVRAASAGVAAGTRVSVVRIGDPKEKEYVVVRLGQDELPFAPRELGLPGKKVAKPAKSAKRAAAKRSAGSAAAGAARTKPAAASAGTRTAAPRSAASSRQKAAVPPALGEPARASFAASDTSAPAASVDADPAVVTPSRKAAARPVTAASPTGADSDTGTTPGRRERRSGTTTRSNAGRSGGRAGSRSSKTKSAPPLLVTLRFKDGDWTVEAQRGSRRLARSVSLRPGAVSAFAEHVDDEALREALVETVDSCRAVVEERADALRAELAAAEAALKDYDAKPTRRTRP